MQKILRDAVPVSGIADHSEMRTMTAKEGQGTYETGGGFSKL